MVRALSVFAACILPFLGIAQDKTFIKRGNLRAQATISAAKMFKYDASPIYIHGDLEYFFEEKFSVRGDSYFSLGNTSEEKPFIYNHSAFAGIAYHFNKEKPFDPYFAFEPGVAYAKANVVTLMLVGREIPSSFSPLISGVIGVNYFANRYFHLLANVRYVHGKHLADFSPPIDLSEVRFSFGLGWNLRIKKYETPIPAAPEFKG
jgi:hypothetical protein